MRGRPRSPYVPLALAAVFASSAAILVRLAEAPPLSVAFFRVFLAALLLSPFAVPAALRSWPGLSRRQHLALLGSGVALAAHFATWITSLSYTSVASSVLLVNTAPLFALVLSRAALKESAPPLVLWAILGAFAGASLIARGEWDGTPHSLTGAALALTGALCLAIYHVIGRGLRQALPLNAYVLAVWGAAACVLGPLALNAGLPLADLTPGTLSALLALALVPTLGGHGLMNLSLRLLPAPTVGLFMLGEPVGASCLAYLLFGETPNRWTVAGGAVVLGALAVVVLAGRKAVR